MRPSKYFVIFTGMFLGLNVILFTVLHKYLYILFHHSITFCREMAKSLLPSLSNNLDVIVFSLLFLILSVTVIKLLITIVKMYFLKTHLNNNLVSTSENISIVNSSKPFAFCFGIRKPKIFISTGLIKLLTKKELEIVITHEKYHLKNHDTLTLMLATIFESLAPYFPLLTDIIKHYRIERELQADQFAIMGLHDDASLVNVLKKLLKYEPRFAIAEVPAIADIDTLEARINKLTRNKNFNKKFEWNNIIVSFISLTFLLFLIFIPLNTIEIHAIGNDTVILCVDKNVNTYYTL